MSDIDAPRLDMDAAPDLATIVAKNPAISAHSRWADKVWRLDGENGGQTAANFAIHWTVKAPRALLDSAKLLAALLFLPRDGEVELKHTTASTFSAGIRHMLRFMTHHSYMSFEELDADALELFRDKLAVRLSDPEWWVEEFTADGEDVDADADDDAELAGVDAEAVAAASDAAGSSTVVDTTAYVQDGLDLGLELVGKRSERKRDGAAKERKDDADELTRAAAYYRLRVWRQLLDHRREMAAAGAQTLGFNPFETTSLKECTQKASSIASDLIPPLPDKVALMIMAKAQALMGAPADDVIDLQRRYIGQMARLDRQPPTGERLRLRAEIENFRFSDVDGGPWRGPVVLPPDRSGGGIELKELISLIRDAAVLTVFAGTGVRIGELCSLVADPTPVPAALPLFGEDPRPEPALPHCVSVKPSKTRMNEHFFMRGRLFKNERTPIEETWLFGSRPCGDDVEPPVLRALRVLERLHAPWRTLAKDGRTRGHLILTMRGSGLPRSSDGVAPIRAGHLRMSLREFIANHCGLETLEEDAAADKKLRPYVEHRGRCIRPHQWRKTFALYMMKVDDRMIPPLAHHFKHLSIAVTENSYMPKDPSMLAAGDSVHMQEAARFFYEQRHAAGQSFGLLDEVMAEHRAEWEKLVADLPFDEALPLVRRFCLEKDIRIFHAEHGRCVIAANPDKARCHEAGGTSSWRNARPNHMTRTPGLCAGCSNFSVSAEHAGYWTRRYRSNQESWLASDRSPSFRVIQNRARQAAAVLKALGVPPPIITVKGPDGPDRGGPGARGGRRHDDGEGPQGEPA